VTEFELLNNGFESPSLASVTERFECVSSALLLEYREGTISRNRRVRALFPFRYEKTFRIALSVSVPLCDLYGSALFSSVSGGRDVSHSPTLFSHSFSLSLSHSFFHNKDRKSSEAGCTSTYRCIRTIDFKVLSFLFFSHCHSTLGTNPFYSLLVKCQIERRSSNRTRLIGYVSLILRAVKRVAVDLLTADLATVILYPITYLSIGHDPVHGSLLVSSLLSYSVRISPKRQTRNNPCIPARLTK